MPQKKRKTQNVHMSGENAEAVITTANAKLLRVKDNRLPILLESINQTVTDSWMPQFYIGSL